MLRLSGANSDFIRNAFKLDPEKVQWAIDGWKMLKPSEPVPFEIAVSAGKKRERIIAALNEYPNLSQQEIADKTGASRRYVRDIGAELAVYVEPKLLNHGGKRTEQADYSPVARNYGNSRDDIIARLMRDGNSELADQVKSGSKSARKAAIEAGFKVPESQLTILKRAWKKASEEECFYLKKV